MISANRNRCVPTAKEWTVALHAQIDETREAAKQELHTRREAALLTPHQQVEMVCHEAISVDFKTGSVGGNGERIKKDFAVCIVLKYVSMVRTSIHDVMPGAGKINTRRARHWSKTSGRAMINSNAGCHTVSDPEGLTPRRTT